jgi:hypothetical protein
MKRHFTIALWMPVRLSTTAPASLHRCGGPWRDVSRCAPNLVEDILSTYYKCTFSVISHILCVSRHTVCQYGLFFLSFGTWRLCWKFVRTFQLHPMYRNFLPVSLWDPEPRMTVPARAVSNSHDSPKTPPPSQPKDTDLEDGNCSVCRNIAKPTTFCMAYSWNLKSYIVHVCVCLPGVPGL